MKHDCRFKTIQVVEDEDGYLFIKLECPMPFGTQHWHRVEFCPVCGMKGKFSHISGLTMYDRNDFAPKESFKQSIEQMNKNIEAMKCYMTSQVLQNEIFIDEIEKLKIKLMC